VVVCAAFAGLIAYTFSRPPAYRPKGDTVATAYISRRADAPPTSIVADAPPGPARGAPERRVTVAESGAFDCPEPRVTDGDTLRCGPVRVRLASIDAPEMPGHCRRGRTCTPGDPFASTDHLRVLVEGRSLTCRQTDTDHYGRVIALCFNGREDLSCSQVRSGHAIIRYGNLTCL
jgi:endonuclease YncB( thermonuclease family)